MSEIFITKKNSTKVRVGYYLDKRLVDGVEKMASEMQVPKTQVIEQAIKVYTKAYNEEKRSIPNVS
tara:strand:- start:6 stop:203 length:198 start_codon:yes stop_codon:yes gene_type:complete